MKPLIAAVLMCAACGDEVAVLPPGNELPRAQCAIAALTSDYSSTSISLLAADGAVCNSDALHSGSHAPGLVTALSGDVVLPSVGAGERTVWIIDRGNGVVTGLDVDSGKVVRQFSVVGTVENPQDLVVLVDGTFMVSQRDSAGDDLVHLSTDGTFVDSVTLPSDVGFEPQPTRLAKVGATIWTGLQHLTGNSVDAAGPGRVVAFDGEVHVVDLPGLVNCPQVAAAPDGSGVWVACSGFFQSDFETRTAQSGLAFVAADRTIPWQGSASLAGAPFNVVGLTPIDAERVLAVAVPEDVGSGRDRLVMVDRRDDGVTELLQARGFTIGGAVVTATHLLVPVAERDDPRIERFALTTFAPESPVGRISKSGLEPRQLTFF